MRRRDYVTFGGAPRIALWTGIVLTLLGLIDRYLIGSRSASSVTPLLIGMPVALLGFVALEPHYALRAMQSVTVLSLLGMLFTLHVLPVLNELRMGRPPSGNIATIVTNGATLLLCSVLLVVCVAAFIGAWWKRRRRGE